MASGGAGLKVLAGAGKCALEGNGKANIYSMPAQR
jgi:hypothetical protein